MWINPCYTDVPFTKLAEQEKRKQKWKRKKKEGTGNNECSYKLTHIHTHEHCCIHPIPPSPTLICLFTCLCIYLFFLQCTWKGSPTLLTAMGVSFSGPPLGSIANFHSIGSNVWIWIWMYTSQKPINGYKRDGTGRAHQLFLYRSPLLLKSSMFIKIVLGGHYNHV